MPKRNLIWILAFLAAAMITLLVTQNHTVIIDRPSVEFDPVTEAYRTIRDNYYYPVEPDLLRREAIGAMVAKLDEYSRYFPPGKSELFADRMDGFESGSGLRLDFASGRCTVIGPLSESPAQQAGLARGDRLVEIDGLDVADMTPAAVTEMLESPARGTRTLTMLREGEKRIVRLNRGRFPLESVEGLCRGRDGRWVHAIDSNDGTGVLYIRIKEILPRTADAVRTALEQVNHPHGLVLDLRDNPGGALQGAVEIADLFLREGTIVTVTDNKGKIERHTAHDSGTAPDDIAMVVLINGNTASAAEIIAGSLEHHGRAALVGRRTCGKGCIQSMILLPGNLGRMNLTTAEFYVDPLRPIAKVKGRKTWGVAPHVEVDLSSESAAQLSRLRLRQEVVHAWHASSQPESSAAGDEDSPASLMDLDAQLQAAMALLASPARYVEVLAQAAADRVRARQAATQAATQTTQAAP